MLTHVFAVFSACFLIERLVPGWRLPKVRMWPVRVVLVNLVQLGVVLLAGVTWERWLSSWSVFALSDTMGPAAGGMLAYFIATFVFYWWHRWRHESDLLWRIFHQIHHSPQRLEVITSFYKHPGEMLVNSVVGSLLVYTVLGLSPAAGAVYTACTALGEFFYHTNVRTPRWIGFFFQRPEMHRIHHQYGRHKNNYGDITWWDMLFGTYENPKYFTATCGFDDAREQRLIDMLLYRDVHRPDEATMRKETVDLRNVVSTAHLQEGDIIFTASPHYLYRKVAEATGCRASHVGILFRDRQHGWIVAESKVPLSRYTPLDEFIERSEDGWHEIRRLKRELGNTEIKKLRHVCDEQMGAWYHLGFRYESRRMFCSKFVHEAYYRALGIRIGEIETFADLLRRRPTASRTFWRFWYFGCIPWSRRTITPASQLSCCELSRVSGLEISSLSVRSGVFV